MPRYAAHAEPFERSTACRRLDASVDGGLAFRRRLRVGPGAAGARLRIPRRRGSTTSKPFELTGGDYAVAWEIERQRGKTSWYVGSRLRRFDDQNPGALVLHTTLNIANDRTASGEARVFSVLPGRYVFDVSTTGCDWRFIIRLPG